MTVSLEEVELQSEVRLKQTFVLWLTAMTASLEEVELQSEVRLKRTFALWPIAVTVSLEEVELQSEVRLKRNGFQGPVLYFSLKSSEIAQLLDNSSESSINY